MFAIRIVRFALYLGLISLLTACGPSSSNEESGASQFEGVLRDLSDTPIPNTTVTLFETGESSITDDNGFFALESAVRHSSAGFFFELSQFTPVVRVEEIPFGATTIRMEFVADSASNTVFLKDVQFGGTTPEPDPPTVPDDPVDPDDSPSPTPTATPTPGKFDSNGNTTAFGIPAGLTGNINQGRTVWQTVCSECHLEAQKVNRSYGQIKAATINQSAMNDLGLTNGQIADVTAYLNRNKR